MFFSFDFYRLYHELSRFIKLFQELQHIYYTLKKALLCTIQIVSFRFFPTNWCQASEVCILLTKVLYLNCPLQEKNAMIFAFKLLFNSIHMTWIKNYRQCEMHTVGVRWNDIEFFFKCRWKTKRTQNKECYFTIQGTKITDTWYFCTPPPGRNHFI